jgi:O-antigen/teichoic acid export membrane protein
LIKYKIKIVNIPIRINYKLLNASKLFLAAQALSFLYISVDPFLITDIYGSTATAEYSISSKLSFITINVFSILLIQFWSSIRVAVNEKKFTWIKMTIRQLMNLTGIVLFLGIVISIFEKPIMQIWLGDPNVITSKWTLFIFSFYAFLHCLNAIYVNIQNGIGELKIQVISLFFVIILYVIACYNFQIKSIGYSSIILFKTISMLLLIILNSTVIRKLYDTNGS